MDYPGPLKVCGSALSHARKDSHPERGCGDPCQEFPAVGIQVQGHVSPNPGMGQDPGARTPELLLVSLSVSLF